MFNSFPLVSGNSHEQILFWPVKGRLAHLGEPGSLLIILVKHPTGQLQGPGPFLYWDPINSSLKQALSCTIHLDNSDKPPFHSCHFVTEVSSSKNGQNLCRKLPIQFDWRMVMQIQSLHIQFLLSLDVTLYLQSRFIYRSLFGS